MFSGVIERCTLVNCQFSVDDLFFSVTLKEIQEQDSGIDSSRRQEAASSQGDSSSQLDEMSPGGGAITPVKNKDTKARLNFAVVLVFSWKLCFRIFFKHFTEFYSGILIKFKGLPCKKKEAWKVNDAELQSIYSGLSFFV